MDTGIEAIEPNIPIPNINTPSNPRDTFSI
jgi:hypothetical protein